MLGQLIPATLHPGKTNKPRQILTFSTEPHTQGTSANTASVEHCKESTADEGKGSIFSGSAIGATYLPGFKNTPNNLESPPFSLLSHSQAQQPPQTLPQTQKKALWMAMDYAGAEIPTAVTVPSLGDWTKDHSKENTEPDSSKGKFW